jgi:hypothetical protein
LLVNKLLSRWWYALDDWPPCDYDYSDKLEELKLRIVDREEWKLEPDYDDAGYRKVTELEGYIYVFVDSNGLVFDLRPQEGKPTFNNFIKKVENFE